LFVIFLFVVFLFVIFLFVIPEGNLRLHFQLPVLSYLSSCKDLLLFLHRLQPPRPSQVQSPHRGHHMRIAALLLTLLSAAAPAQTPVTSVPPQTPPPVATAPPAPTEPAARVSPSSFDVATIKPSDPARCCGRSVGGYGRKFNSGNTTLRYLMQYAYSLQPRQIVGGPAWFDDARFDVAGVTDGEAEPTDHQWKIALQKLLTERFQLQIHHESRELPAYVLTIAKGGAKLTKSDGDPNKVEGTGFGGPIGGTMVGSGTNVTLTEFIGELQRLALDRPVVDRTGITGIYNLQIKFTRDDPQGLAAAAAPPADDAPPTVFTAIQEQLGLKLEPAKAPVDVLVIDHAEKPSAN
jgi:uncharacterized protein (TIGR03435 family)